MERTIYLENVLHEQKSVHEQLDSVIITKKNLEQQEKRFEKMIHDIQFNGKKTMSVFQKKLDNMLEENSEMVSTDVSLPSTEFMEKQFKKIESYFNSKPPPNDFATVLEYLNKGKIFGREKATNNNFEYNMEQLFLKYKRIHKIDENNLYFLLDFESSPRSLRRKIKILLNSMNCADDQFTYNLSQMNLDITTLSNAIENRLV